MGVSKDEIIDLATRYVSAEEITDFTVEGDVFALLIREVPEDKVLSEEEGWSFSGYGICFGYTIDHDAKPTGKWLWMHFASLQEFPPVPQVIRLQPPHIVKGRFQNPERTHEIRILKVNLSKTLKETPADSPEKKKERPPREPERESGKIVQFRKKGSGKK
ncbi:MAG: hypothetical protein ACLFQB_00300 [Chitinispirillaceae bacterium]